MLMMILNKVAFPCLLVVLAMAYLATGENVAFDEEGGARVCDKSGECQSIGSHTDATDFLMSDEEILASATDESPIANATGCPLFDPNPDDEKAALPCPRCTWDDRDRCCATCRHYSRVPFVIPTSTGPCYTLAINGRYQYTLNGFCRNPKMYCSKSVLGGPEYRCLQKKGVHSVLCLKINWPQISWSVELYTYPAYCSCQPV